MVPESAHEIEQQAHQVRSGALGVAGRPASRYADGQAARADKRSVVVAGFRLSEKGNQNHFSANDLTNQFGDEQ